MLLCCLVDYLTDLQSQIGNEKFAIHDYKLTSLALSVVVFTLS